MAHLNRLPAPRSRFADGAFRRSGAPGGSNLPPKRRRQISVRTVSIISAVAVVLFAAPSAGASKINVDRTKIKRLEQQITAQGSHVQALVSQSNAVAAELASIRAKIASNRARLAVDHQKMVKAQQGLRKLAVADYVSQSSGDSASIAAFANSANAASLTTKQEYLGVVDGRIKQAIANLQAVQHETQVTTTLLQTQETQVSATLVQSTSANQEAQNALNQENASLGQLSGNLLTLVSEANAKAQAAKEKASEAALASQQQTSVQQNPPPAPSTVSANVTPGTYANPLRSVGGLAPERIDQGVDFQGFGPIYAVGDGVVISTYNGGWPGGTFISYRLVDGPASGLVVYAAEDIYPKVQVGQSVNAHTVIGQIYEGPDGIETGWAEPAGNGTTMASGSGEFGGGNSTAFGYNFSRLLSSLGAPGGILQNNPPYGSLPNGWPQF